MEVEKVQQWVLSALVTVTATIFAGGLALLSSTSNRAGARPGLLVLSGVVGLLALVAVRLINRKSVPSPWLVLGLLPAVLGWYLTRS